MNAIHAGRLWACSVSGYQVNNMTQHCVEAVLLIFNARIVGRSSSASGLSDQKKPVPLGKYVKLLIAMCLPFFTGVSPAQSDRSPLAEKLYEISVFTAEDTARNRILDTEVELLSGRFLARQLAAHEGALSTRAPMSWPRQLERLKSEVMPIAARSYAERVQILKAADLYGKAPYVREYEKLLNSAPVEDSRFRFSDGGTVRVSQTRREDIPEILEFHKKPAVSKWRKLWPELRVYAARMVVLDKRLDFDLALGASQKPWQARVGALQREVGGTAMTTQEWNRVVDGRLGYTLAGMHRFTMPLGTGLHEARQPGETVKIDETKNGGVLISSQSGTPLNFRFLDAQWGRDFSKRLSTEELQVIDQGLTATYDKNGDRWFAPLGLEWDVYVNVQARIAQNEKMQKLFGRFAEEANSAMTGVWSGWKSK